MVELAAQCPICRSDLAEPQEPASSNAEVESYACPRCGGYPMSRLLREGPLRQADWPTRLALSRWVRLENDRTGHYVDEPLTLENFEVLAMAGSLPKDRDALADELIGLVARIPQDLDGWTRCETGAVWEARLGLPAGGSFTVFANAVMDEGFVDHRRCRESEAGLALGHRLRLTTAGRKRLAEFKASVPTAIRATSSHEAEVGRAWEPAAIESAAAAARALGCSARTIVRWLKRCPPSNWPSGSRPGERPVWRDRDELVDWWATKRAWATRSAPPEPSDKVRASRKRRRKRMRPLPMMTGVRARIMAAAAGRQTGAE